MSDLLRIKISRFTRNDKKRHCDTVSLLRGASIFYGVAKKEGTVN